jgi:hypothetical protein
LTGASFENRGQARARLPGPATAATSESGTMFNPSSSKGSGPTESWAPPAARSRLNSTIRLPKQAKVFSPLHPTIYPFLVAPLVAGGKVSAPDRPEAAAGVDAEFCGLVQALGAEATLDKRRLTVRCKRRLAPSPSPPPRRMGPCCCFWGWPFSPQTAPWRPAR